MLNTFRENDTGSKRSARPTRQKYLHGARIELIAIVHESISGERIFIRHFCNLIQDAGLGVLAHKMGVHLRDTCFYCSHKSTGTAELCR